MADKKRVRTRRDYEGPKRIDDLTIDDLMALKNMRETPIPPEQRPRSAPSGTPDAQSRARYVWGGGASEAERRDRNEAADTRSRKQERIKREYRKRKRGTHHGAKVY